MRHTINLSEYPIASHPSSTKHAKVPLIRLSVSLKVESVVSLPRLPATSSCLVVTVTLTQTSGLLASSCQTTRFTVLVNWVNDPVDTGIPTNCLMLGVDEDDFVILVGGILVDPVGVENTQIGAATSDSFLCS